jgi:hypothetical protein
MIGDYLHRFGPVLRRFRDMLDGSHAEVVAVDGDVTITDGGGSITVDGPLTDEQLRAAVVPVSDGGESLTVDGPLTDAELAARLPLAVDGPLTDAQLAARLPLSVGVDLGTPTVSIVTLTLANTEYNAAIAKGRLEFRARTEVAVRFAFATGKVASSTDPYATLRAGEAFSNDVDACTLYLASASDGTVVEVINYAV